MTTQIERAISLKNLHVKGSPLILFNIWDAGSAQVIQETGAKAVATGSFSVAAAHGYEDGEMLPFDLTLANLKRIIAKVHLPVTFDMEGGYGKELDKVQETAAQVIKAGAVGINFEDQIVGSEALYSIEDQCTRIKAIRKACEDVSIPLFINARTDMFFKPSLGEHNENLVEEALKRAFAYAEAGADGFFVPGLKNIKHIEKLCKLLPIPVNVMVLPDMPTLKQLAHVGVARISYGPYPYFQLMKALKDEGRRVLKIVERY